MFNPRELLRAALASFAFAVIGFYIIGGARLRWFRWAAFYPEKFWSLHLSQYFGGRASLSLAGERQLLIVGTMGSGTTATAQSLTALGLEIKHESSDTQVELARDGTVSWAHALRYLAVPSSRRASLLASFCSRARHGAWHAMMYDGGRLGGGFDCKTLGNLWDACWARECRRVADNEIGCALNNPPNCTSPFRKVLLQVRHPLRTIESNVVAFCRGHDDAKAAKGSVQLDTLSLLVPPPPRPTAAHHGSSTHRNNSTAASGIGECARQFGWWWVAYHKWMLPHAHVFYRVEDTTACEILNLGGVIHDEGAPMPVPESAVPRSVALVAQRKCSHNRTLHAHTNSKNANHKNGAKGTTALRRSYADIAAFDPALEAEISRLAKRLGYVD